MFVSPFSARVLNEKGKPSVSKTEGFLDSGYLQEVRFPESCYLNAVINASGV